MMRWPSCSRSPRSRSLLLPPRRPRSARSRTRPPSPLVTAIDRAARSPTSTARLACYDRPPAPLVSAATAGRGDRRRPQRDCARRGARCSASAAQDARSSAATARPRSDTTSSRRPSPRRARCNGGHFRIRLADGEAVWETDRELCLVRSPAAGSEDRRSSADRWAAISCASTASAGCAGAASASAGAARAGLGLEAGVGVDIGFLPRDAPVAQFVERDRAPVTAQTDMVAVGRAAGTSPPDSECAPRGRRRCISIVIPRRSRTDPGCGAI